MSDNGAPTKRKPSGDYDVGYCRPPEATRFKKGQSGNLRGRPRKSNLQLVDQMFRNKLKERITVTQNGREVTMTYLEAAISRQANDLITGTPAQRRRAFDQFFRMGWFTPSPDEMRPRHEVIAEFVARLAKEAEREGAFEPSSRPDGDQTSSDT